MKDDVFFSGYLFFPASTDSGKVGFFQHLGARLFVAMMLFSLIGFSVSGGISHAAEEKAPDAAYLIGTGDYNSTSYAIGSVICHLSKTVPEVKEAGCKTLAGTSLKNIYNLHGDGVHFAILEDDWPQRGYMMAAGEADLPDGSLGQALQQESGQELRRVFGLHEEMVTVLVRDQAPIKVFDDLKGKRVSFAAPGTLAREIFELSGQQNDWGLDDFHPVEENNIARQIKSLCDGEVDAVPFVMTVASFSLLNMLAECGLRAVPFDEALTRRLIDEYDVYSYAVLPTEMDDILQADAPVLTLSSGLLTYADMDDEIVYKIVQAVFENLEKLKKMHPVLENLDHTLMLDESISLPFHAGALKYYREQGWK